jgi:activator of HSP90 ATPase
MKLKHFSGNSANRATRRKAIAGMAVVLGGMAANLRVCGQTKTAAMQETPGTTANSRRTSIHQEIALKATAQRIYKTLLDSEQFAAVTGMPASIAPEAGGKFSMFGGMIVGMTVELASDQRIVQAWRPAHWDPGVYSIVKFEFKPQSPETVVVLDHTGFPEGQFDHLDSGWHARYWEPLKTFLAKQ